MNPRRLKKITLLGKSLLTRLLASALCAALVLLSPGYDFYQAEAAELAPEAIGADYSAPWSAVLRPFAAAPAVPGGVDIGRVVADPASASLLAAALQAKGYGAGDFASLSSDQRAALVSEAAGEIAQAARAGAETLQSAAETEQASFAARLIAGGGANFLSPQEGERALAEVRNYRAGQTRRTIEGETASWSRVPSAEAVVAGKTDSRTPAPIAERSEFSAENGVSEIPPAPTSRRGGQAAEAASPVRRGLPYIAGAALAALAAVGVAHFGLLPAAGVSAAVIGSILVHEAAHLWALRRLGEDTAERHGVASANPFGQLDPVGTLLVPVLSLLAGAAVHVPFVFGWAKPVPVDFNKVPDPKRDPAKVAMAGVAANLGLAAALGGLAFVLPALGAPAALTAFLALAAKANLALGLFNLIPLPQMDGGKLLVSLMSEPVYKAWTRDPRLPDDYQSVFQKLYQGPANLLSRLPVQGQAPVNFLSRLLTIGALGAFYAANHFLLGLPLLFLILPCSYDYYCIREKIQNENATNEMRDLMRGFASALAKAAEEDPEIKSDVNTYEVEHLLKNAFEDLVDKLVDSDGFSELSDEQKWERFSAAYEDAAVAALHGSAKGMPADSPEAIRRLLRGDGARPFWQEKLKAWVDRYEVWQKWKSPGRKSSRAASGGKDQSRSDGGKLLGVALLGLLGAAAGAHFLGLHAAGHVAMAAAGVVPLGGGLSMPPPPPPKTFEEALQDPDLHFSDKDQMLLLSLLKEMKQDEKPPVTGLVDEMNRVLATVTSPRGVINSVVLVGKPGVGKTAAAEKLAQAIAYSDRQDASSTFRIKQMDGRFLVKLNLGRLLKSDQPAAVLDALLTLLGKFNAKEKRKGSRVILFVDEIHSIFQHRDASMMANLLKEPLRDGELTTITATTEDEYKKFIESDDAFRRRLIRVDIPEAGVAETVRDLQGARKYYEDLYGIAITPEALRAAAELSRFDTRLFLPGRAFHYLEAAAKNASYEGRRERLANAVRDAGADLRYAAARLSEELSKKSLITEGIKQEDPATLSLYNQVVELTRKLLGFYKELAAIPVSGVPVLTADMIRSEIARETHISMGQLTLGQESMEKYLRMEEILGQRVVGQPEAVSAISKAVRMAKAGIADPNKPLARFYLTGPTGTGKTQLAKELARFLFDDPNAVIRLDMSEYMEKHSISRMIGSPPGYVGHDDGGQLTEAVRNRPYSVILFDEIEKAHPDVFLMLLQILADGRLTDGKGRTVDFKNTLILMTSNLGMSQVDVAPFEERYKALQDKLAALDAEESAASGQRKAELGRERGETLEAQRALAEDLARETKKLAKQVTDQAFKESFPPEFRGRLSADPILFNRISPDMAARIVDLNLSELAKTLPAAGHTLEWTPAVSEWLAQRGFSLSLGARPLQNEIERDVTQPIADEILKAAVAANSKPGPQKISLSVQNGKIAITLAPLPPKKIEKEVPTEGAEQELFARVLETALSAASNAAAPELPLETLDAWAAQALGTGATPSASTPAAENVAAQAPASPAPAAFFGENERLDLTAPTIVAAAHNDARSKDVPLNDARKALAQALAQAGYPEAERGVLVNTVVESGREVVGWLKLFAEQAKARAPEGSAPVELRYQVTADGARVLIHRAGDVSEREAAALKLHFTGPVPDSKEKSFSKAETLNVMGKEGREPLFELYRALAAIPGARLGYAVGDKAAGGSGTDYWVELPAPPPAPSAAPAPETAEAEQPSDAASAAETPADAPTPAAAADHSAPADFPLPDSRPGQTGAFLMAANGNVGPEAVPAVQTIVSGLPASNTLAAALNYLIERLSFLPIAQMITLLRSDDGLLGLESRPANGEDANGRIRETLAEALPVVLERAAGSGLVARLAADGRGLWLRLPGSAPAPAPAPRMGTLPPSAAPAATTTALAPGVAATPRGLLRAVAEQALRQGDERGPTVRMSAAEAWGAVATPSDLAKARDWIRFADNLPRHYAEVGAAAAALGRLGDRAEDGPRLELALALAGNFSGDLYNPAKALLVDAMASSQATTTKPGVRKLLARYEAEKAKSVKNGVVNEGDYSQYRNRLLIEALYEALCRYGGPEVQDVLLRDWEKPRIPALYAYLKREDPEKLKTLVRTWHSTHTAPDGLDQVLLLSALADYGNEEDIAALNEILMTSWANRLELKSIPPAAQSYARLVARLKAYRRLKTELRQKLGERIWQNGNFNSVLMAVMAAGEAGDAEDLPLLENILRVPPTDSNVSYMHEMTQHEAALAWAKRVVRLGLVPSYLKAEPGAAPGALPKLLAMLSDPNPIVNKAAIEALRLCYGKGGPAKR